MRYKNFFNTLLNCGRLQSRIRAFTMVELLLAIAILGTLSAVAVPVYTNYTDKSRAAAAVTDIRKIESAIVGFRAERGRFPDNLAEAGIPIELDPWGHAYDYTRLEGLTKAEREAKCQWNKQNKPLNHDFDLWSYGKDGLTEKNGRIDHPKSYDDIIRANAGEYVGPASEY